ncbi:MAG TPA: hypothetical protein VE134_06550, partial [Methanomicrobiales archaeon]|nr:hypothetical protein [Methanomicrobiales archaeon]
DIVGFISKNTGLIVFIALLFLISDLFTAFAFPLNLPAPFFTATAGIFLVALLFQIFRFVGNLYSLSLFGTLDFVEPIIYPLLFLAILIAGYLQILHQLTREEDHQREREGIPAMDKRIGEKTWDDIGMEFRQMVYDILHRIREDVNRR